MTASSCASVPPALYDPASALRLSPHRRCSEMLEAVRARQDPRGSAIGGDRRDQPGMDRIGAGSRCRGDIVGQPLIGEPPRAVAITFCQPRHRQDGQGCRPEGRSIPNPKDEGLSLYKLMPPRCRQGRPSAARRHIGSSMLADCPGDQRVLRVSAAPTRRSKRLIAMPSSVADTRLKISALQRLGDHFSHTWRSVAQKPSGRECQRPCNPLVAF